MDDGMRSAGSWGESDERDVWDESACDGSNSEAKGARGASVESALLFLLTRESDLILGGSLSSALSTPSVFSIVDARSLPSALLAPNARSIPSARSTPST